MNIVAELLRRNIMESSRDHPIHRERFAGSGLGKIFQGLESGSCRRVDICNRFCQLRLLWAGNWLHIVSVRRAGHGPANRLWVGLGLLRHPRLTAAIRGNAEIATSRGVNRGYAESLEHVPEKLRGFFDRSMLQLFEFELFLSEPLIPSAGQALEGF